MEAEFMIPEGSPLISRPFSVLQKGGEYSAKFGIRGDHYHNPRTTKDKRGSEPTHLLKAFEVIKIYPNTDNQDSVTNFMYFAVGLSG